MTNQQSLFSTISAFASRACPQGQRRTQLLYSAAITLAILGLAFWLMLSAANAEAERYWPQDWPDPYLWKLSALSVFELADILAMIVLSVGCFVVLPASVASLVATERKTKTMDQLRATPAKSLRLLAGFVLGAPARIYLILAGPLLLHVGMGLIGVVPLYTAVYSTLVLLVGALAAAVVGAALALSSVEGKGGSGAMLIASLSLFLMFVTVVMGMENNSGSWAFLHPAGAINASYLVDSEMWRNWSLNPWELERFSEDALLNAPLFAIMFAGSIGLLLGSAATRRIAQPEGRLLRSYEACGLFALAVFALVLPVPGTDWRHNMILPFGCLLLPIMAMLLLGTQQGPRHWAMTLRKQGRVSAPWAATFGMLGTFAAVILLKSSLRPDLPYYDEFQEHYHLSFPALGWLALTAASLAILVQFASARYDRMSHRGGFYGAMSVHLIAQILCCVALADGHSEPILGMVLGLGILVPAVVVWRTSALRARVRQAK